MPSATRSPQFLNIDSSHRIIAHASGGSQLGNYPNAIECLDHWHAAGVRYFEFDLQWTIDRHLFGLHDWGRTFRRWFDTSALPWHWRLRLRLGARRGPPWRLLSELPMRGGLTPITPERLAIWLASHPEAWLVTDVKRGNPEALRELALVMGKLRSQVVAQVFSLEEIKLARELGFGKVGWANYIPKWSLADQASRLPGLPLDVVVLDEKTLTGPDSNRPLDTLRQAGFEVWVFTVNDPQRLASLPVAVNGIITDQLQPAKRPAVDPGRISS